MKLYIASDHAGFELKQHLFSWAKQRNVAVIDIGTYDNSSCDYPLYAKALIEHLLNDDCFAKGVLICGSGIGMSIMANRFKSIRAALCRTKEDAMLARQHNDANVLVLGARNTKSKEAEMILETFNNTEFEGVRHERRVALFDNAQDDKEIFDAIALEAIRQKTSLELIASENIVSPAVLKAQGSVLTNKYAEGYPGKRYYGGCQFVDRVETLAIERVKALFDASFANVQPHSGSQANQAVFAALLAPGDKILGMSLDAGGHLTHGSKVNMSGKWFDASSYGVSRDTGFIDYDEVAELARINKPKLIIAGGSAYPRMIDFKRFRQIANEVGAYLMVDMAHFAGLVAGGVYENPIHFADIVTSTTHKTLRGPRGGIILTNNEEIAKKVNAAIFPGIQGGPLMHVIAAKAVAFKEALDPSFKVYAKNVVSNAKALCAGLINRGYKIFTDGTDTHLLLLDLSPKGLTGLHAEHALESVGLSCNKNAIPFDTQKPFITSGIRLGSPACTTRGLNQEQFVQVANLIADVLDGLKQDGTILPDLIAKTRQSVLELCAVISY